MENNDDAKVNSKYDDTIIVKVGGLTSYEYYKYYQNSFFIQLIEDLKTNIEDLKTNNHLLKGIEKTYKVFTQNNDTKKAVDSLSEIAKNAKIDIDKSNTLESLCDKIRNKFLPDKITCHRPISQFFYRPEDCQMLEEAKENMRNKNKVKIISWSWGNYDALELVEWALENGKEVEWKILNVANERYLNPLYYMGCKKSFLEKLENSNIIKDALNDASNQYKKLKILHNTPTTPNSTCCANFAHKIADAISTHPNEEIKKLDSILKVLLQDNNTVSI